MPVDLRAARYPVEPGTRVILWVGRRGKDIRIAGLVRWRRAVYTACRAGFETILVVTDASVDTIRADLTGDPRLAGRHWAVVPVEASWATAIPAESGRWVVFWDEWVLSEELLLRLARTEGPPAAASSYGPFAADADDIRTWATAGWQPSHPPTDSLHSATGRPAVYERVSNGADAPRAEEELLRDLVPPRTNFFARHVDRVLSRAITRRLMNHAVTPNQITIFSVVLGVTGGLVILDPSWLAGVFGIFLFLVSTIVDGCDGEIARLKFEESPLGARLDFYGDNVVHFILFPAMAIRHVRGGEEGPFLWLALSSVVGLAVVILAIYVFVLRQPPSPGLRRLFETFQNREFAYVLFLLAIFDRIDLFVWAVAIGVWVFPVILAAVALYERRKAGLPDAMRIG